jgi:AcrR family transcriptional regulator
VHDEPPVERRAPYGYPVIGERGGDTRRRILAAALAALNEVGFDELRVDLIAERAQCSRPTFYQYFSSKRDVFWTLARQLGDEMVSLADTLPDVTPDRRGLAQLTRWVASFMELHHRWAPVFAEFPAASLGRPAVLQESQTFSTKTAAALVHAFGLADKARAASLVRPLPMMQGMLAVLMRASFYAEMAPRSVGTAPVVQSVAELLHRMFCGPLDGVNVDRRGAVRRRRIPALLPSPSPRRLRGRKAEQTRQRLIEAGLVLLSARGFRETSVDDITAAAGVSHGTFYRYFSNREDLLQALAEAASERTRLLLDQLELGLDETAMRTWLRRWFESYDRDGGILSVWQERPSNTAMTAYSQRVAAWIYARLVELLQRRDFGDPVPDATAFLALLERLPHSVHILGYLSEDDGIDTALVAIRRGFVAADDRGGA